MPNITAMLAAAHDIKVQLDVLLLRCCVKDSGEHRVAAALCLTIAEQFSATLHLIEGGFSSHAPVMVRSMLEGHANLLNVVSDPAFVDQIRHDNARADVAFFTEYAADPAMQENTEAQETLAKWKADAKPVLDELKTKGYRKLDLYQRFKRANIQHTYVTYRVFCSFAHNQLTTLLARHADRFELRYHCEAPEALTASLLNVAVGILCQAVITASHYTDLSDAELREVIDSADAKWSAVKPLAE